MEVLWPPHIAGRGHRHVLVVTDEVLNTLDLLTPILEELQRQSIAVTVHDQISPDPTFEQVDDGAVVLRESAAEAVLAIGGGSVLDAAKLISACATNHKPVRKMTGMLRVRKKPLPIFAVPTTAGTGSEVTVAAVVTDAESHRKFPVVDGKLLPHAVALDGALTQGLPAAMTAATGMDVLTHAIEAYVSRAANWTTRQYALSAARRCFKYLPAAFFNGEHDLQARQQMLLASHEAGRAINQASAGYVHAIAHQVGALYHVPHGIANAIILPHVLQFSRPHIDVRLAEMALFCDPGQQVQGEKELADAFAAEVQTLNAQFGIPDKLVDLQADDLAAVAAGALREARMIYAVPRPMRQRDCETLLKALIVLV